jgi:glycine betaine catabolism A
LLNDQEILLRHLHKETAAWVADYQHRTAGV